MSLLKIDMKNKRYLHALTVEENTWSKRLSHESRAKSPRYHPLIQSYSNEYITGDHNTSWQTYLKKSYNKFHRGLSLGGGVGFIEQELISMGLFEQFEMYDLSEKMTQRFLERMEAGRKQTTITVRAQDLNFLELEEKNYDFILCNTILHHIINLEHLLMTVNSALTEGGIFVIYDYIGENRFQWSKAKMAAINLIVQNLQQSGYSLKRLEERSEFNVIQNTPFEAIRSEDIVPIVDQVFGPSKVMERKFFNVLHPSYRCLDFKNWSDENLRGCLSAFVEHDREESRKNQLQPCTLFGIYRKAKGTGVVAKAWSNEEVRSKLSLPLGIRARNKGKMLLKRILKLSPK